MSTPVAGTSRKKLFWVLGGTVTSVLVAGVAIQFFKAPGAVAVEQPAASQAGQPGPADARYVGRVNRQHVTRAELAEECLARYGAEVLDSIINRLVIQHACEERGISVTHQEVDQEILRIAKRFNLPADTWFEMLRTERNLTPEQYRRDVIWPMLALKKLAGEAIVVQDADIQRAFVREYGPRVKAKMIMLDNLRRAQTVWEQVAKTPDDFERLARESSIEPNSRALGGAIPPIRRTGAAETEALEKAAFGLRAGEISGVVQVGMNRYVILLCEGRTEPVVTELDRVKADLHAMLLEEETQKSVARVFEKLKTSAQVDNYITGTRTGGVQPASATAPGQAVAPGAAPSGPASSGPTAAPRSASGPASPVRR